MPHLLKLHNGLCRWNGYVWYYSNIDITSIDIEAHLAKPRHYACKKVINLTTGRIYDKIKDCVKYSSNLAKKLRDGNGHCFYKNEEWALLPNATNPVPSYSGDAIEGATTKANEL